MDTPDPPMGRRRRGMAAVALVALATVAACASRRPTEPFPPTPPVANGAAPAAAVSPVDNERLNALYLALDDYRLEYLAGVEMIAAGDEVTGEERTGAAADGIGALTRECATLPGCDLTVFAEALQALLGEQAIAMKRQAMQLRDLRTDLQEVEALSETTAGDLPEEPGSSPYFPEMPAADRTVSLLRGTDLRDIISLNGPVSAALDDWLTWLRPMLLEAWENYQFLRGDIVPIYEEAGLPEALLFAIIATETGGKVHAVSRAGATGPLQFMRRTGQKYGLRVVDGFDQRYDPVAATRANVAYLNDRFRELNDSLEKALAAYNGGEGRMESLHRRYGGASFWDKRVYYSLPRETREYVPRVLAAAWLFLHPEDYGLEFPEVVTETATLALQAEIAINELSVCLGQEGSRGGWFRTLRNLNPRLDPGERLPAGSEIVVPAGLVTVYRQRCLEGPLLERARKLHDANYPEAPEMIPYVVRRGDTLGRIASRFRCASIGEIADLNRIRPPRYVIHVGQVLKIPACD